MKRLLFSAVLALGTFYVQSQELPKIIPPTPEAASLGKFTEVPVSHYTGVPNISIPIYTINAKGISIPINLSYHARGVMVEEVAPRVGIGWALSYGGSLSRQVRGQADNRSDYLTVYGDTPNATSATGVFASETSRRAIISREGTSTQSDLVPDLFSFNAGGTSGSFIMDRETGDPLLQEYDDIIIEYDFDNVTNNYKSFTITDKSGNKFIYGEILRGTLVTARNHDITTTSYVIPQSGNYSANPPGASETNYSSWQLLQIETLSGDKIDFSYNLENSSYVRRSYDKRENNVSTSYGSEMDSYQQQLSEITFPTGKIVFVSETTDRQDLTGSKALDKVQIFDKNNVLIKEMDMEYTYSDADSYGTSNINNTYYLLDATAKKRLMLTSVQEKKGAAALPKTKFNYSPITLPNRFSNSQDSWGYFNGADNGAFLTFYQGANPIRRNVNEMYSEAGMLQNIEYPTGGKVQLTFEHNVVQKPLFYNSILTAESNPRDNRTHSLTKANMTFNGTAYEKTVLIEDNSTGSTGNYEIFCQSLLPVGSTLPNCNFSFTFTKIVSGITGVSFSGVIGGSQSLPLYTGSMNATKITEYKITATPLNGIDHTSIDHNFTINTDWGIIADPDYLYGAGKRIKKIEHLDNGGVVSSKEYDYSIVNNGVPSFTSGLCFGIPFFYDIMAQTVGGVPVTYKYPSGGGSPLTSLGGNSIGYSFVTEFYGERDNNIGKTEYRFTNIANTGNYWEFPYHIPTNNEWIRGKAIYTKIYRADKDNTGGITGYTLRKEINNKYLYGNTTVTNETTLSGPSGFLPVDFIFTPQEQDDEIEDNLTGVENFYYKDRNLHRTSLIAVYNDIGVFSDINLDLKYKTYQLTGGSLDLKETTEKTYNDTGTLENTTTYNYDYNNHYQQKGSTMTDSNGDLIETINYYPVDVGTVSSLGYDNLSTGEYNAIHKMKAPTTGNPTGTNQVAAVVQVETKKNTSLLSTVRTNFELFSGLALPKRVETSKGGASLEDRIVYHDYYANGNVKEVSKTDGTSIVYIWGYDETVPVAKIENATSTQVSSYIAAIQTASNNDNDRTEGTAGNEGALRSAITTLRNALPNARVTSFTYDPLIGVTSITDPRGRTAYYVYDSFNRLQYIKDHDGNVLSKNEYHYKN
ncbi:hypothetical protein RQM59_10125 [Flavobacteriaceae bacterium S356]|uniref:YD repeat-containing protein n=1 Tax=Asprobacillus argus TaxID=3076534 RepID=A0ABU3LG85_9FLAO|nr:hypothetical protein [Flavobacteriaceae bacterium S356]